MFDFQKYTFSDSSGVDKVKARDLPTRFDLYEPCGHFFVADMYNFLLSLLLPRFSRF